MPFPGEDVTEVADDLTAVVGDEMGGDQVIGQRQMRLPRT